jgi:hypothetical protein
MNSARDIADRHSGRIVYFFASAEFRKRKTHPMVGVWRQLRQLDSCRTQPFSESGRNPGKFQTAVRDPLGGVKPEPERLSTSRLWITPATGRASPIRKGIIEGPAAGTPDPVSGDPRARTTGPPAGRTIQAPTRRNRSTVPLTRGAGRSTPVTIPTIGHWIVARTQRPGLHPYRGGA